MFDKSTIDTLRLSSRASGEFSFFLRFSLLFFLLAGSVDANHQRMIAMIRFECQLLL